jgi:uncharacterized membrane protein YccC
MLKSFVVCAPLGAIGAAELFAQASPVLDPGLGSLIGNVGVIGVLVWFLWYQTSVANPSMLRKFAEEVDKLRTDRAVEREKDLSERAREREEDAREKSELRTMLFQTMQSMRTAVHDVKDTAQLAINKSEILAETSRRQKQETKGHE